MEAKLSPEIIKIINLAIEAAHRGSSGAAYQFIYNFSEELEKNGYGKIEDGEFIPSC